MYMTEEQQNVIPPFIRRLMPDATEGELSAATEVFKRYVQIVIAIYERTAHDKEHGVDSHKDDS